MFLRNKENFTCEHCAHIVRGTGYTNHCPQCLWSKHVDVAPGDRKEFCGGMMEPVAVEYKSDGYALVHRCVLCGMQRRNKTAEDDDVDALIVIARKEADSVAFGGKI